MIVTPPAYRAEVAPGRPLFDLVRVAGANPADEELDLAKRVRRLLDQAREHLERDLPLKRGFEAELTAAVECGLTGPPPRRPEVAAFAVANLERSLLGPFRRGGIGRDDAIVIMRNLAAPAMSDDQRAFMAELDQQERLIRSLFRGEEEGQDFRDLIARARSAAQIGLLDMPADVRLARFAMAGVVQDAIRERGQKARAAYLGRLGQAYLLAFLGFAVALFAYWLAVAAWPAALPFAPQLRVPDLKVVMLGIAIAALFCGAWLSAVARLQPDSPEVLDGIFTNTFTAPLRALFILGFGLLAILLLYKKAIVFSFGPDEQAVFTSAQVLSTLSATLLTGAFLGLGEAALPNAVIQRSAGLVSSIGGAAGK